MIISDNFCQLCVKNIYCEPHLNRLANGSNEGSQHVVSMRIEKILLLSRALIIFHMQPPGNLGKPVYTI